MFNVSISNSLAIKNPLNVRLPFFNEISDAFDEERHEICAGSLMQTDGGWQYGFRITVCLKR